MGSGKKKSGTCEIFFLKEEFPRIGREERNFKGVFSQFLKAFIYTYVTAHMILL